MLFFRAKMNKKLWLPYFKIWPPLNGLAPALAVTESLFFDIITCFSKNGRTLGNVQISYDASEVGGAQNVKLPPYGERFSYNFIVAKKA